jgi:MoaA/NifB/PqqE/SkfB family radical SAM enzyme
MNSLTISLDGPQETHNEVRGSATGFQRLKKNVMKLIEWKKRSGSKLPNVQFSCAVSALNQAHLAEIVDVAEEVGIEQVNFGYLFFSDEDVIAATDKFTLTGQADFADQKIPMHLRKVDLELMKSQFREARRRAAEKGIKIEFNPPLEEHELEARYNDKMYFYTNKCFLPWYETRINPFGDIYSCQIDTRLGNIREKPFIEIWNDGPYREFRKLIKEHALLPKCSRCCKLNDRTWNYLPRLAFGKPRPPRHQKVAPPPGLLHIGAGPKSNP